MWVEVNAWPARLATEMQKGSKRLAGWPPCDSNWRFDAFVEFADAQRQHADLRRRVGPKRARIIKGMLELANPIRSNLDHITAWRLR